MRRCDWLKGKRLKQIKTPNTIIERENAKKNKNSKEDILLSQNPELLRYEKGNRNTQKIEEFRLANQDRPRRRITITKDVNMRLAHQSDSPDTDTHTSYNIHRATATNHHHIFRPNYKSNSCLELDAPFFPQQLLDRTRGESVTEQLLREAETVLETLRLVGGPSYGRSSAVANSRCCRPARDSCSLNK